VVFTSFSTSLVSRFDSGQLATDDTTKATVLNDSTHDDGHLPTFPMRVDKDT